MFSLSYSLPTLSHTWKLHPTDRQTDIPTEVGPSIPWMLEVRHTCRVRPKSSGATMRLDFHRDCPNLHLQSAGTSIPQDPSHCGWTSGLRSVKGRKEACPVTTKCMRGGINSIVEFRLTILLQQLYGAYCPQMVNNHSVPIRMNTALENCD